MNVHHGFDSEKLTEILLQQGFHDTKDTLVL